MGRAVAPSDMRSWGWQRNLRPCYIYIHTYCIWLYDQRKFRSQTSDNMDRWKSRGGKSQRREEKKREDQRRERARRKKMQVREKVGNLRFTVFFQWFVAPEGRKVGSLKRQVRSHVVRWEMKSARRCGAKHIYKSKCRKHRSVGPLLEVDMSKKCTLLWREAHVQVKSAKKWGARSTFGCSDVVLRGRRRGLCTLWKVSKAWRFCSSFKNHGRRGTFEDGLERGISRGRRSMQETHEWQRFPEKDCILEHEIFRFAKMILRDRCSTSYDLASLFRGRRI